MRKETFSQEELAEMIADYSFEVKRLSFQLENTQKALADLLNQAKAKPAPAPAEEAKPTITEAVAVKEKKEKPAAKTKKAKATVKPKAVKAKPAEKAETPKRRGRPRKEKAEIVVAAIAETEAPKKKRGRPKKEASIAVAEPVKKKESKIRTLQDEESQPKGYRLSDWDLFIINTIRKSGRVMITSELMDKALSRVKKEKLDMDEVSLRGKLNRSIHKLSNRRGDLVKVEEYPGKGFAYGVPEWKDEDGKIREEYMASMN
jgi:predicted nucleic acid-binding protein